VQTGQTRVAGVSFVFSMRAATGLASPGAVAPPRGRTHQDPSTGSYAPGPVCQDQYPPGPGQT
jgi:hypothetical protein